MHACPVYDSWKLVTTEPVVSVGVGATCELRQVRSRRALLSDGCAGPSTLAKSAPQRAATYPLVSSMTEDDSAREPIPHKMGVLVDLQQRRT